jgi:chromosome partitioning protein
MAAMTTGASLAEREQLSALVAQLRERGSAELAGKVITVMAGKGGIGKTLLAMELAWLLSGVLLDLDWDDGNASVALGHYHDRYTRAPLLDALENGRAPRPRRAVHRPDLVPCHPDFAVNQPEPDTMAKLIIRWAQELQRGIIADTHPGGSDSTLGAAGAADLIVMPVVLGTRELNALEGTLKELVGYPILLVPNWVPPSPPATERRRLRDLAARYSVSVGPVISTYGWLRTRKLRTVITAAPTYSKRTTPVVRDLIAVAGTVLDHAA